MSLSEADTRAKLIDPALYKRGWTEDQIKREETAGAIDVIGGKPRRRARGRIDYLLRVKINIDTQPVAMALIEAKGEGLPPTHGLEQAKAYAESNAAGSDYLADLRGSSRDYFVATTVDLLTTGVDVPIVRNIVFFRYVRSPISFYQMIRRGTRLDIATNKLMFRMYDYTNATRLFGEEFKTRLSRRKVAESRDDYEFDQDDEEPAEPLPLIEGIAVRVTEAGRLIPTLINGRTVPVPIEVYKQLLAEKLLAEASTLEAFRKLWIDAIARDSLLSALPDGGRSALVIRVLEQMENYDLYDVLAELGYGLAPRTRAERAEAFGYKNEDWLVAMPEKTAATVKALAAQFARGGTEELENTSIFQTPAVKKAGGLAALAAHDEPAALLRETKERLFGV